jgi:hypothetical protein
MRFAAGIAAQVVATLVVCASGMPDDDGFGVLLVLGVLVSLTLGPLAAAGLGLIGWALFNGFVTNSLAQLTFRPDDVRLLAVLVGSCAAAACLTGLITRARQPERRR